MRVKLNLDWLDVFIDSVPSVPEGRKSIIDIAGLSYREVINSNLLAYFLDPNEEHNLSEVFFRSLIEIISQEHSLFDVLSASSMDYNVDREVTTNRGGRIDLVLHYSPEDQESENDSWAIIIENKIHAKLYNELEDYWNSINADTKIGVILSFKPEEDTSGKFTNVLHTDFAENLQRNLVDYFLDLDGRELFLVQEYLVGIRNIASEMRAGNMADLHQILRLFIDNSKNIQTLKQEDKELIGLLSPQVTQAFTYFGFSETSQGKYAKSRRYLYDNFKDENHKAARKLRFWVDIDALKYNGELRGAFELWGDSTEYANTLVSKLENKIKYSNFIMVGKGGKQGGTYFQVIYFKIPIPLEQLESESLYRLLEDILRRHLLGDDGPIWRIVNVLGRILKKN